jgi:hypothetical protein
LVNGVINNSELKLELNGFYSEKELEKIKKKQDSPDSSKSLAKIFRKKYFIKIFTKTL